MLSPNLLISAVWKASIGFRNMSGGASPFLPPLHLREIPHQRLPDEPSLSRYVRGFGGQWAGWSTGVRPSRMWRVEAASQARR